MHNSKILLSKNPKGQKAMTNQGAPENYAEEIVERLNEIASSGEYSEFEIARFERDIESVKRDLEKHSYFSVKGMLACIRKQYDRMHQFHKNAILYSNSSAYALNQYAVSLKRCKMFEDAYEYAQKAAYKDSKYLKHVIELGFFIDAEDLQDWISMWDEHYPDSETPILSDDNNLTECALDAIDESINIDKSSIIPADKDQLKRIAFLVEDVDFD